LRDERFNVILLPLGGTTAMAQLLTHIIHCEAAGWHLKKTLDDAGIGCELVREAHDCRLSPACRWLHGAPLTDEARLIGALDDVIEVLERTRHAFRSRELGALRRRLERLLNELPGEASAGERP